MKKLLFAAASLFLGTFSFAQEIEDFQKKCATYTEMEKLFENHPEIESQYYANKLLQNSIVAPSSKMSGTTYVIPVVVHILHMYGSENISDQRVYDLMERLNIEFNAADPDSVDLVAEYEDLHGNARIEFKLAAIDPFGNCTNGIDHIYTHETFEGDAYSKLNQWNRAHYLNIWVVQTVGTPGAAAYATQPGSAEGTGFWTDGVVTQNSHVIGSGSNESVITHEVGHYFNLDHVWGDLDLINNPPSVCGDDGVSDTPLTQGWLSPCPTSSYPNGWIVCGPSPIPSLENVYSFDSILPTTGTIDPTPVPTPHITFGDPNISVVNGSFTATGVSANPTRTGSFGFSSWDTGALDGETVYTNLTGSINTSKYYEFTVAPESRGRLYMDFLTFDVARDTVGARTYAVRWDVDGYATNLDLTAGSSTNPNITVDDVADIFFYNQDSTYFETGSTIALGATEVTPTAPVTFRIYAWNAENATGDFVVDNVRINGSVGLVEDVQNYMEYSYCDRHFTPGQVDRMHTALEAITSQRNELWVDSTLEMTGVDAMTLPQSALTVPLCAPIADFTSNRTTVCQGNLVQFSDESWNGAADTRLWEFEGGTPATSTSANVNVSWDTYGWKNVKLTVTNSAGTDSKEVHQYLYVSPNWPDNVGPASYNMNSNTHLFLVQNPEDNYGKFKVKNSGGSQGNAWKLENFKSVIGADYATDDYFYNDRLGGSVDALITPSFDLQNTTSTNVTFKYAYATNAVTDTEITERFKVYTSTNCGETWVTSKTIQGTNLVTAGYAGGADYVPSNDVQWVTESFNVSSNGNKVRFKFEFEASDVSSNLWIDDISVNGTLSISDDVIANMDLQVYPNPTSGEAINVTYTAQNEPTEFILRDVQGKIIAQQVISTTNAQVTQALNNTENLASSYYFLEVKTSGSSITKKVVVL